MVSIGRGNAPRCVAAPPHRVEQPLDQLGGAVAPEQLGVQHGHRDQHAADDDDHDAPAAQAVQAGAEPVDDQERADQREPERDVLEAGHRDRGLEPDGRERPDRGEQHRDHALADRRGCSAARAPSPSPRTPRSRRTSSPRRRCAGSPRRGPAPRPRRRAPARRRRAGDRRCGPPAPRCTPPRRSPSRRPRATRDRPAPEPRPGRPARPRTTSPHSTTGIREAAERLRAGGERTAEEVTDVGWPGTGWSAGPRRAPCGPASR